MAHQKKPSEQKNFIKDKYHRVCSKIKTLHQLALQTTQSKLLEQEANDDPNLYQLFLDWLLDYVVLYGLSFTYIHNVIFGWEGLSNLALIPCYGLGVWLVTKIIIEVKDALRNN